MSNLDSGIYQIENTINGNIYIGQTINLSKRDKQHFRKLAREEHENRHIQRAFLKYGASNFAYSIILHCETFELTRYEQELVNILSPEYNICKECVDSTRGVIRDKETIENWKKSYIGKYIGREVPEETRQKISSTLMNHLVTDETRNKMSIARKDKPSPNKGKKSNWPAWNKGLKMPKHSEEQKQKTSRSLMGHAPWSRGKKWTEEQKEKLRNRTPWNKGIRTGNLPEETRYKMSMSQKIRRSREAI